MNRRFYLNFLKTKVIVFVLVVLTMPTLITWYIDCIICTILINTDPFSAILLLPSIAIWKSLIYFYIQYLCCVFLISLFWNVCKVVLRKENRQFWLM